MEAKRQIFRPCDRRNSMPMMILVLIIFLCFVLISFKFVVYYGLIPIMTFQTAQVVEVTLRLKNCAHTSLPFTYSLTLFALCLICQLWKTTNYDLISKSEDYKFENQSALIFWAVKRKKKYGYIYTFRTSSSSKPENARPYCYWQARVV